ncbi:uncharacterized protein [Physeter macrocephalus]|uniref:Uncharacterized protein isoform X2 n=1 Tax=Physeter macrocephalus TaxID=9755 RepID=A0A9W2WAU0_PHYMC|nr:uncharacterized protein LOC102996849 isoform X2 [Physeter catodon]
MAAEPARLEPVLRNDATCACLENLKPPGFQCAPEVSAGTRMDSDHRGPLQCWRHRPRIHTPSPGLFLHPHGQNYPLKWND